MRSIRPWRVSGWQLKLDWDYYFLCSMPGIWCTFLLFWVNSLNILFISLGQGLGPSISYHPILFLSHICHPIHFHGPNLQLLGVCWMQIKLILDTQGQLTYLLAVLSSPPPINSSLLLTSDILSSPLGSTQVEGKLAHCLSFAVKELFWSTHWGNSGEEVWGL